MEKTFTVNETIITLIENKKFGVIKEILITMNCVDIAELLQNLPPEVLPKVFRLLPKELAAETFVEMETDFQELLIKSFSDNELREIINEIYADDAVDIIEEMPANVVNRILKQAAPAMRKDINTLLKYPEDSAGSVMTTEFIALKSGITVEEAIKQIRKSAVNSATVNTCYITEKGRVLLGYIDLSTIILASAETIIDDIMERNVISVTTDVDQENVAKAFNKYDVLALPVVDYENRLVGIITVDDAIDVMEDEATEDIEKMTAILPSEKSYFKTSVIKTVLTRIPWLLLLMISATFTGLIISNFQAKLALFPALIAFIPMIMGTAGNSGSQASVTIIRSISLGDVRFSDIGKVIFKEIRVAFLCGLILTAVNFIKVWLFDILLLNSGANLLDNLVVCITLMFTVMVAKVVGCILPLVAQKIGLDPAVMASPFITTIVDALSLLVYFIVASIVLF